MPQAIVDPDDLRRFATSLKKFNNDVRDRLGGAAAQMASLEKSWRDQEQKKFTEEFEQHMKVIARFMDITEQHIPYLIRKAEAVDQYLQSR